MTTFTIIRFLQISKLTPPKIRNIFLANNETGASELQTKAKFKKLLTNEVVSELAEDVSHGDQPQHVPLVEALQLRQETAVEHLGLVWKEIDIIMMERWFYYEENKRRSCGQTPMPSCK